MCTTRTNKRATWSRRPMTRWGIVSRDYRKCEKKGGLILAATLTHVSVSKKKM
jgi:hypothetical protein